jgi:hypothetical protein
MELASRIVFVRVGRMISYSGPREGDERPEGGGKHNVNRLGHEAFNFFRDFEGGTLYGTFGIMTEHIDLLNIDPTLARDSKNVGNVLVVFVAPYDGGQRIVGWYRDATVYRASVPYPREVQARIQKHFDAEGISNNSFRSYRLRAQISDGAVLLPEGRREQDLIPSGHRGEMGQFNVCYAYKNGVRKTSPWIQRAIDFIDDYHGSNLLNSNPEAEAKAESFDAQERAAGFQPDSKLRVVIEQYAMKRAKKKLGGMGFNNFVDTSSQRCYDYRCKKRGILHYVEVKGTQGSGASVILTKNEIKHGQKYKHHSIAVIVHHIRVNRGKASKGTTQVCFPWILEGSALAPTHYKWTVSRCPIHHET